MPESEPEQKKNCLDMTDEEFAECKRQFLRDEKSARNRAKPAEQVDCLKMTDAEFQAFKRKNGF